MGQVHNGLHGLFESNILDLVEQDGKHQRDDNIQHQLANGNDQGVADNVPHIAQAHQVGKVVKPDPGGTEPAFFRHIVLERHDNAHHGHNAKQDHPDKAGDGH